MILMSICSEYFRMYIIIIIIKHIIKYIILYSSFEL